jgi:hypothetical protein
MMTKPKPTRPFDFARELDKLVASTPDTPEEEQEARRWAKAMDQLYPVALWRRISAERTRRKKTDIPLQ